MIARTYSRYSKAAITLLGKQISIARKRKKWSEYALAERAGVSRATVQKIERGEPGTSIGLVFELATLVGIALFDADLDGIKSHIQDADKVLTLLPKSTHHQAGDVDDNF